MIGEFYQFYNVIVFDDEDRVLTQRQFEKKKDAFAYYFHMIAQQEDAGIDSEICIYQSNIDLIMSHKGRKEN